MSQPMVTYEWTDVPDAVVSQMSYGRRVKITPRKAIVYVTAWRGQGVLALVLEGRTVTRAGMPGQHNRSLMYVDDATDNDSREPMTSAPPWARDLVEDVRAWERARQGVRT